MIAISTVIGIILIAVAAFAFFKFAKGTVVTILALAGVLIGLFLLFGVSSIPNLNGYVNKETLQGMIPGTGSAVYSPSGVNITSLRLEGGNLIVSVKNIGDLPINSFEIIANERTPVAILNTETFNLSPGKSIELSTNYKPTDGDIIVVIANGVSDGEIFINQPAPI